MCMKMLCVAINLQKPEDYNKRWKCPNYENTVLVLVKWEVYFWYYFSFSSEINTLCMYMLKPSILALPSPNVCVLLNVFPEDYTEVGEDEDLPLGEEFQKFVKLL